MSVPELPYKISSREEALSCIRKITQLIDELRGKLRLDLNEIRSHLNKVQDRNQSMLQIFKLQMQPQEVPVSDISCSKVPSQNIFVLADLDPDLDHFQAIDRFFRIPSNHDPYTSRLQT